MITQNELKQWLAYHPESGRFVWIKGKRTGQIAGTNGRSGYIITILGKRYPARRLAWLYMTGAFPPDGKSVCSISQNPLSSRWSDLSISPSGLRCISREEVKDVNLYSISKRSSLLIPGVYFDKSKGLYKVTININGKRKYLGYYKTVEEAEMVSISARERVAEMVRKNNP